MGGGAPTKPLEVERVDFSTGTLQVPTLEEITQIHGVAVPGSQRHP